MWDQDQTYNFLCMDLFALEDVYICREQVVLYAEKGKHKIQESYHKANFAGYLALVFVPDIAAL